MTSENDYQLASLAEVRDIARRLSVDIEVLDAGNDAIVQTKQLLDVIQRRQNRPEGIICNAVGSGMPQVAHAAAAAGISWAIMNREVDYLAELWDRHKVPACTVRPDQTAVGQLLGRQANALLPHGGSVLCITGPSSSGVALKRLSGMQSVLKSNIEMRTIHGQWTRESATRSVTSWLQLSTARSMSLDLVVCHNDDMAAGARQAFSSSGSLWQNLRYTGVDGLPDGGQKMVRQGSLAATVVLPITSGIALEQLVESRSKGLKPPIETLISPHSFPDINSLSAIR
jgi:ABC-type sugar transport system substrate-binding protein